MTHPAQVTRVVCAQVAPVVANPVANQQVASEAIQQALEIDAKVIVLPELMTTGYHLSAQEVETLAERPEGESMSSWIAALAGSYAVVAGGFVERGDDGRIYNSAALVDANGILAVYRKSHLWAQEYKIFTPGSENPPVIETRWGAIGLAICYDLFFPELVRGMALAGAQLLVFPTNSPADDLRTEGSPPDASGIGYTMARAAGYGNRIFVAVSDRHGDERGTSWTSRSVIVDPEGRIMDGPAHYEATLLIADCALDDANNKRWEGTDNNVFADRRPDLYGVVAQTELQV